MEFNATFIVSAISFVVFSIIMNAIFYKPLAKVVEQRETFVKKTLEEAKQNATKSESIIKDKEKKIEKTKQDAKKIIVDKTEEVKSHKATLAAEAQQKAVNVIESAKDELQKSQEEAQKVLAEESEKLAMEISSKLLGKV